MEHPLVTVVIPTYNSAAYLAATLDSVLSQTYTALEIVVVDDGSTDETATILAPYMDRVRYLKQENWGGPSRPRNVGVAAARGELVAFFDSDDLMMADKIESAVMAFRDNPELGLIFTNFEGIDEQGRVLIDDFLTPYQEFRKHLTVDAGDMLRTLPSRAAYSQLLNANFIGTSSVVCRKDVFDQVGAFDETMLNADDIDMWRRIAYAGYDFAFLDRILHRYRKRGGGVTARGARRYPAVLNGLSKQLHLELQPWERRHVENRLLDLELAYGSALCDAGDYAESQKAFRAAFARRLTWRGIKGWLKLYLRQRTH